jgi:hypothetical protein
MLKKIAKTNSRTIPKVISNKKKCEDAMDKLEGLSRDELRELLLINTYKLALTRAQIDAIVDILIKKGITSYNEVWKKTNEIFKENKRN